MTTPGSSRPGPVRLLVLEGDGIGPEITAATLRVLAAVDRRLGLGLRFETAPVGLAALRELGTTLPRAREADDVILAPVSHLDYLPVAGGGLNPSGELRRRLNLYANVRPARSRGGVAPFGGRPVDLVIVRENTRASTPTARCSRGRAS